MSEQNKILEKDEVLFAFHRACDRPTGQQIAEWTKRYPQYSDDIRAHAAIRSEWAEIEKDDLEPDESMLARGRSYALNLLHNARQESAAKQSAAEATWFQLVSAAGFDIPHLARCINIDRMVLAELNAGRMRLPIGERLMDALTDVLKVSTLRLSGALGQLLNEPKHLGHAKADGPPIINTRSYSEVIRASPMSPEDQRFWLGED